MSPFELSAALQAVGTHVCVTCTDYLLPVWPLSFICPSPWQECSAIGGWWSCWLSGLHLEPCTCPSTALCHVSPGCADSLVTCRLLSALIHKLIFPGQSQCTELEKEKPCPLCEPRSLSKDSVCSHFLTSALQLCMNRRPAGRWKTEGSTLWVAAHTLPLQRHCWRFLTFSFFFSIHPVAASVPHSVKMLYKGKFCVAFC